MAATGKYVTGAAHVMLFVDKLSKMTFDQGRPDLFLDYCEEHLEAHKGMGLYNKDHPHDPVILTETVLAAKNVHKADEAKLDKVLEAVEASNSQMDQKLRSRLGEINALTRKFEALEKEMEKKASTSSSRGPPGPDNKCNYCGSEEHFLRESTFVR